MTMTQNCIYKQLITALITPTSVIVAQYLISELQIKMKSTSLINGYNYDPVTSVLHMPANSLSKILKMVNGNLSKEKNQHVDQQYYEQGNVQKIFMKGSISVSELQPLLFHSMLHSLQHSPVQCESPSINEYIRKKKFKLSAVTPIAKCSQIRRAPENSSPRLCVHI